MPSQAELEFADEAGRYFAMHFRTPPAVGRVLGWLLVCDPPDPTAADIAADLGASRSGVGEAIKTLEQWKFVRRVRRAGERADRVLMSPQFENQLDSPADYAMTAELVRRGLEVIADAPEARKLRLLELEAFNDFVAVRMPELVQEWRVHVEQLRATGKLPRA